MNDFTLEPELNTWNLYTAEQVRELDRLAIEEHGIPGIQLMKRAGRSVLETLLECWPEVDKDQEAITVFCGGGNNGGDGYIVAALAKEQNIPVTVVQLVPEEKLKGDARRAYDYAQAAGVTITPYTKELPLPSSVVVDALLGTGFKGELREPFAEVIDWINASGLPVVSVDVPSGLCCDTGAVQQTAVEVDLTVSFIGLKRGVFTGQGPAYSGEVFFDDLEVPADIYEALEGDAVEKLSLETLLAEVPPRAMTDHKGKFGHVLVIGGAKGFGGAALMAAESAARSGAGLVSLATELESHVTAVLARLPEVMAAQVTNHHELEPLLERASVLVIGPGLGQSPWSEQMIYHAISHAQRENKPVVLDADGLNILSEGRVLSELPEQLLLTPHPGEAGRLLGSDSQWVQQNRFQAVEQLAEKYRASVILKGSGTLVASDAGLSLCPYGNPGMATGGMGDVLSGVLGGLWAQGLGASLVAELGVALHAYAADCVAEEYGERGMLPTDLLSWIQELLNA